MNAYVSMPAGSFHQQKTLSNYTTRNEFTEALHSLLSCDYFRIPSHARTIIKFYKGFVVSKEHIGVLNARYEIIAEYTGKSKRTIERGFKWLKDVGLITTCRTTKQDGTRGADYKVFASLAAVKKFLADYVADCMSVNVADCQSVSNPCESKTEGAKNETDISSFIKNQKYKNQDINNKSIKENDSVIQPVKKFGIKKEIKTFLENSPWFNLFDDMRQHEIAKRVQLAFIKTHMDYTDIDNQEAVKKALHSFVRTYEKENNLRDDEKYYGALYRCLVNELKKEGQEALQNETEYSFDNCTNIVHCNWLEDGQTKPQEAAQAPKNDFEYKDIRRHKKTSQEPKNEYEALWNKYKGKSLGELTKEQTEELELVYERCQKERGNEFDDRDTSDFAWHRYEFKF